MIERNKWTKLKAEEAFHDLWADHIDPSVIDVRRFFASPAALDNKFARSVLGDLTGKRVLDIGPGLGESSVCFALDGAEVVAVDVSAHMLELLSKLAAINNVQVRTVHSTIERAALESESFDIAFIANALHHVSERREFIERIRTLLKPGGIAVFIDPLKYNPIINIYRWLAWKVRTVDEQPLSRRDLRLFDSFSEVQHREFWLLSLLLFVKYFLVDRLHPNEERYWKRMFNETHDSLGWWMPLAKLDTFLTRLPGIRWLCWNTVIAARK